MTGRGAPKRDIRFTVFVIITHGRPVAVLSELCTECDAGRAALVPPGSIGRSEDRKVRTRITVKIAVDRDIAVDTELLLNHRVAAAV